VKIVGLFAGIGGLEKGLGAAGHDTILLCEIDPFARAVLEHHFEGVPVIDDVRTLAALPAETEVLTAGFPCQDLSQAGGTRGISGEKSGVVSHLFRLIEKQRVPHILIENVSFMLQLERGRAMQYLVDRLEALGYRWAYRVVDARAFGLPQRRQRVFLLASRLCDPAGVLLGESHPPRERNDRQGSAYGFYWTEGTRGLGWANEAIPTLKGGSGLGIPSPPAIWVRGGGIRKPSLGDAERLQGFPRDWTAPALAVGRHGFRWRLVGNAVPVKAAEWLGTCLNRMSSEVPRVPEGHPFDQKKTWPTAAHGGPDHPRLAVACTKWPLPTPCPPLSTFLEDAGDPLSLKAVSGFINRLRNSRLNYQDEFMSALLRHQQQMQDTARLNTGARSG